MNHLRFALTVIVGAGLALAAMQELPGTASRAIAEQLTKTDALRPEVGTPLQAAESLLKEGKYKAASAKLRDADDVKDKTPYEALVTEQVRAAIAAASGDLASAAKSYEAIVASGRLARAEQDKIEQAIIASYFQLKDYGKAASWALRYSKEGGTDPRMRTLLIQSHYLSGDFAAAGKEELDEISAEEKLGEVPPEAQFQLAAASFRQLKDGANYAKVLEALVTDYPNPNYWRDLIHSVAAKPGFAERLSLDVKRLEFATGSLGTAAEYVELIQLALQARAAGEAKLFVAKGVASGVLGTGSANDLDRQKRLEELTARTADDEFKKLTEQEATAIAQKDTDNLVSIGYDEVIFGQTDKGTALITQGIDGAGLKHPDDAKLHLGLAYLSAGQRAKAAATFKTVQGSDGTADLARLWLLFTTQQARIYASKN
jgi:hypothetical protein